MLANLHIENFALIEQLDIDFPSGFAIITGETGAGKSIMLGALSLLMGTRADMQARRNPERRMVAEAVFRVQRTDRLSALLSDVQDDTDVQDDEKTIEIILRREISPTDRSRAFVNDSPVNLKQLTAIASQLVDIHTQHSNLLMERPEFQLGILDAIADDSTLLNTYKRVFNRYAILRHSIKQKREVLNRNREQEEYITFRLEQLRKLKPRAGEQAELERRLEILSAAEEIRSSLGNLCRLLDGNESAALPSLHDARLQLAEVNPAALPPQEEEEGGKTLLQRLHEAEIEVRDIAETLHSCLEEVEVNPTLLQRTEERLEAIYAEEKRFGVDNDTDLVKLRQELEQRAAALADGDDQLQELEHEAKLAGQELKEAAAKLTEARKEAAERFAKQLIEMARPLGLSNLKFTAKVEPAQRMTSAGADIPQFLCAFNKNQQLRQAAEIASGGELSRLMLCIKAIVAGKMQLPTIIFDEVDTGVSGDIADRMGRMMRSISNDLQVIAITHLPQVAVMGDCHFKVYKEDAADTTLTHVVRLSDEQREQEIARMLSGSVIDHAALMNARSLLAHDSKDFQEE